MAKRTETIEVRFPSDINRLAEGAAAGCGLSLSEYLVELVQGDAPQRLQSANELVLSPERFEQFLTNCKSAPPPSAKLKEAAQKLDKEGF